MDQKTAIADRLKQATNILVTVSNNPSVDQLASCIGLTLALNKLDKHATAVFSGSVPSTIEFLSPEKTIEKNTDSLRDFIIALDKSKADKLRYKVEDKVVKIFITPYRTSINEKDLEFSQGDFNVDVVLAIGVHSQQELDQAITAHGRILHDAVVATLNIKPGGDLGTMNWLDTNASSLSELATELVDAIDKNLMDGQMATALLTGIVSETNRFSNDKTSPTTMTISAELMTAGANQQLVATKLDEPPKPAAQPPKIAIDGNNQEHADRSDVTDEPPHAEDGTLEIDHDGQDRPNDSPLPPAPEPEPEQTSETPTPQIHIDNEGSLRSLTEHESAPPQPLPEHEDNAKGSIDPTEHMGSGHMILQPPSLGGELSASGLQSPEDREAPSGSPTLSPSAQGSLNSDPSSFAPPAPAPVVSPSWTQPSPVMPTTTPANPYAPAPLTVQPSMSTLQQPTFQPPEPIMPPSQAPSLTLPSTPPAASQPLSPPMPLPEPTSLPVWQLAPTPQPSMPSTPPAPTATPPSSETLSEIEQDLNSPHLQTTQPAPPTPEPSFQAPTFPTAPVTPPAPTATPSSADNPAASPDLESARQAVMDAIAGNASAQPTEPIVALNAQPLGAPLHDPQPPTLASEPAAVTPLAAGGITPSVVEPSTLPGGMPNGLVPPPPVPPPMMPGTPGF